MDDLAQALSSSFAISKEPNSTAAPHPRLAQYKSKYSVLEQSERRRRFLDLQKKYVDQWNTCVMYTLLINPQMQCRISCLSLCSLNMAPNTHQHISHSSPFRKRFNYVNHARHLADGDWTGADDDTEEMVETKGEDEKQVEDDVPEMEIEQGVKLPKYYANQVSQNQLICTTLV